MSFKKPIEKLLPWLLFVGSILISWLRLILCFHIKYVVFTLNLHCILYKSLVRFALRRVTILKPQFVEYLWFVHHLSFIPRIVYSSSINSYPSSSLLRHLSGHFKFYINIFTLRWYIKFKYTVCTCIICDVRINWYIIKQHSNIIRCKKNVNIF